MAVQVIKAKKQTPGMGTGMAQPAQAAEKLKVAAYCRVSTDSEEQESSYEAQCTHYTQVISENPDWTLAGIYADEGITGTSLKKREQFKRMMADCEAGRIDMIITKSISRWARNTVDSLNSVRKLRELGIPVIFEKETIDTSGSSGELYLTIMASIAQSESESISRNVILGKRYKMQQGKGELNGKRFCGLSIGEDGSSFVIDSLEDADLIRRIYREYLEGWSPEKIGGHLTMERIPTPAGKEKWYASTVASILENEKYCGDLLLQKYFTEDFLTKKIVKNTGQLPQYFVENHHEPIVPKKVFVQVQMEKQRRGMLRYDPSQFRTGNANALAGRIICGHCGRTLKRYTNPDPALVDWRCRKRAYEKKSVTKEMVGACPCRIVLEKDVKAAIVKAFNQLPDARDSLIALQGGIWNGDLKRIDVMVKSIEEQQVRMQERLDALSDTREDAETEEARFLMGEIERLETERVDLLLERADLANTEVQVRMLLELVDAMKAKREGTELTPPVKMEPACYEYEDFFNRTRFIPEEGWLGEDGKLTGFHNDLVRRFLENVTITDDTYIVNFKAQININIPA